MLGDVREPLRANEVGRGLDERREAPGRAVGNGRDRRLCRETAERRAKAVLQCAGRAKPVRELLELSHDRPRVFEQRLPLWSQRYRRQQRVANHGEPPHRSTVELTADPRSFRFCGRDEARTRPFQVGHLTSGRRMEPGIAQRKLGGGRNAIGQDGIDGPSLVPDQHADLEAGGRRGTAMRPEPSGRKLDWPAVIIHVRGALVESHSR